jgi:anti-sigma B factor antagonist
MTSPVVPAPAVLAPTTRSRTTAADLPVARTPEPVECGTPLAIVLDEQVPDEPGARGRGAVLRVAGEIDLLTVAQLRAALDQALAGRRRALVVDVREVSFVACAGIGLLVDARCRARRRGVQLQVLPSPAVARTSALLDLSAALGLEQAA